MAQRVISSLLAGGFWMAFDSTLDARRQQNAAAR